MARIGQNPAKSITHVAKPQDVTAAVITYIPFLSGYYAQSLDVLKICLTSLREHADLPLDLMVFDNASCPEVRNYLTAERDAGKIQYLVLSDRNIGKVGAWNFIFGAAPGEYIAYADSDVYFYPGWLSRHLEVFAAFPQVGMVTGMPMWSPEKFSTATLQWAERIPDVRVKRGCTLPWADYWRHARSLGMDKSEARARYAEIEVICLEAGGTRYYLGAAHFQFVAPKAALQSVLPIPSRKPMGEVRRLDIAINERGYLRVSLPDWRVQHLGNRISGETVILGKTAVSNKVRRHRTSTEAWYRRGLPRKALYRLYHRLFEILEG